MNYFLYDMRQTKTPSFFDHTSNNSVGGIAQDMWNKAFIIMIRDLIYELLMHFLQIGGDYA